ncbi:calcium-binding protein [Dapis sp. BLCC M229]|uniref:calcium-binding protein n=1 Tax=Dapis sp. BLCC M229 TaxID=3400188 RepID=UPI003CF3353E
MDILLTDGPDSRTFLPGELQPGFSIFGLRDDDILTGSDSDEIMFGGKGADQLFLEGGNDQANGNNERDLIVGGAGNDIIRGGKDVDLLIGGPGDDILYGDRGVDGPIGSEGADTYVLLVDNNATDGGDLLLDFKPEEGDRLALVGDDLRPEDIVLVEVPTEETSRNDFFPLFPPGLSLEEAIGLTQIPQDLFNVAPEGVTNFELQTPGGQAIARIFLTTEADIRNSFVELPEL